MGLDRARWRVKLKNTSYCTKCGEYTSYELTWVIDPNKPRYAKKKDWIIGYLCEKCERGEE